MPTFEFTEGAAEQYDFQPSMVNFSSISGNVIVSSTIPAVTFFSDDIVSNGVTFVFSGSVNAGLTGGAFHAPGAAFVSSYITSNGQPSSTSIPFADGSGALGASAGQISTGSGFNVDVGDTFKLGLNNSSLFTGTINLNVTAVNGQVKIVGDRTTGADFSTMISSAQNVATSGNFSSFTFTMMGNSAGGPNQFILNDVTANITCFVAGTKIATSKGDVTVENLSAGDRVKTADGGTTTVRWVGKRAINTRFSNPDKVNPVCFAPGAFGNENALMVSPDHAIEIDGVLVNASALVNGDTVYQFDDVSIDGFTYYHVETDAHEVILAEGIPCETYLHDGSEWSFDNIATRPERDVPEMDKIRISSARLLPAYIADQLRTKRAA